MMKRSRITGFISHQYLLRLKEAVHILTLESRAIFQQTSVTSGVGLEAVMQGDRLLSVLSSLDLGTLTEVY